MTEIFQTLDRHYRYVVLAASIALLLIGNGTIFALVVALKPIALTFHWPREVPSLAYSMQYIGGGLGGIVMGYWLDRMGMGWPALIGAIMLGLGAVAASLVRNQLELYLVFGVMSGFFGQATLFSPLPANIIRWFDKGRGTATGLVASGQSLAGALWPPTFQYFYSRIGWRETFFWFGIFSLVTMVPLSLIMRREPPGASRADADGKPADTETPAIARTAAATTAPPSLLLPTLCAAVFCCCTAMSVPISQITAYASDIGIAVEHAAELLSVMLFASFLARIVGIGPIADRYGGLVSLFIFSSLQASMLLLLALTHNLVALFAVAAALGFGTGGIVPSYPMIVREFLPAHQTGRHTGTVLLFASAGMAFGGWLGGFVYDRTGAYTLAFLIAFAFNLGNLVVIGSLIYRARHHVLARVAA